MASISFPTTPNDGDTYTYDGITYRWYATKSQWRKVTPTINLTALETSLIPGSNVTYDLGTSDNRWRDLYLSGSSLSLGDAQLTSSGNTFVLPEGSTVGNITIGAGGATVYANVQSLPKTSLTAGNFAFVGNTLFITNGSGWYSVGVTNQSPSLTLSTSSIVLGATGNTINFTFTATDPDGPTPTVTLETTANSAQANVTLYTSNNTVTVENLSATDYSANITLTATDGIDQTFGTVTLTVGYASELWDETLFSVGTNSTSALQNNSFVDRSTNAHTVTTSGSPTQTAFHPYLDNWSHKFATGTTDWIASNSQTLTASGDFTMEIWHYQYGNVNSYGRNMEVNNNLSIEFTDNGTSARLYALNTGSGQLQFSSVNMTKNAWHHIAIVRSSGTITVYLDGTSVLTKSDSSSYNFGYMAIGSKSDRSYVIGGAYISNARAVIGTALYTTDFTPPTEKLSAISGTAWLTCQSNRFIDNSSNALPITVGGSPEVSSFNPFGQGSEYAVGENKGSVSLDGSSDYMSISDTTAFDFSTGYTCVEAWIYPKSIATGGGRNHIFTRGQTASPYNGVYLRLENGYPDLAGSNDDLQSPTICKVNEWSHVVFQFNPNGEQSIWLNGVRVADRSNGPSTVEVDVTNGIGHYDGGGLFDGYISDLKIRNGVSAFYSGSTITIPTAPVGNTNASLYLPMDNAGIFDKTGNHTLTLNGNTTTSTTQTKFADTAIYFDGTDYIGVDEILIPATDDFTIELWAYPTSGSNIGGLVAQYSGGAGGRMTLYINDGVLIAFVGGGSVTTSININEWSHIAWVRQSGTDTLYLNGVSSATGSLGSIEQTNTEIGRYNFADREFIGYIENLQILKGVAKYTTNFTPPTSTQGIIYQAES